MQYLASRAIRGPLQALCDHVQAAPGSEARSDHETRSNPHMQACSTLRVGANRGPLQALCDHVQAPPGSEARSDHKTMSRPHVQTCITLQVGAFRAHCKLCVIMYRQHLALGPGPTHRQGLTYTCKNVVPGKTEQIMLIAYPVGTCTGSTWTEARSSRHIPACSTWLRSHRCKLYLNMYRQHLALRPGMT